MQHHQFSPIIASRHRRGNNLLGFSLLEVLIAWFIFMIVALTIRVTLSKQLWQLHHMYLQLIAVNSCQSCDSKNQQ